MAASMRPGQAAPEFFQFVPCRYRAPVGFNEAGAGCPGIRVQLPAAPAPRRRFNEAGAGCPGIRTRQYAVRRQILVASMRPGQAAPEFTVDPAWLFDSFTGFNEAGAGCPGIQCDERHLDILRTLLQ